MKRRIVTTVVLLATTGLAYAQDPRVGEIEKRQLELELELRDLKSTATAQPTSPVTTSGEFVLRSADGAFKLVFRGYIQADTRLYIDTAPVPATSTFLLRRARPILEGTLFRWFGFKIQPDFATGTAVLFDCYAQLKPIKEAVLTVGKFKPPVGLERLQSAAALTFIERALPTNLTANRDVGVMLSGEVAGGAFNYQLALLGGAPDLINGNLDTNDEKDLAARVFLHPFRPLPIAALHDLGVGFAYENGRHIGNAASPNLPIYLTLSQLTFFSFVGDGTAPNTALAWGDETRLLPQGYWYVGPVSLMAEYATATQRVKKGNDPGHDLDFSAWQVAGSFVIGGRPSWDGVLVGKPVGPHSYGALEIAARYTEQHNDKQAFGYAYADATKSAQAIHASTAAFNWYANRDFKIQLDYEYAEFVGGGKPPADSNYANRGSETTLLTQVQVAF